MLDYQKKHLNYVKKHAIIIFSLKSIIRDKINLANEDRSFPKAELTWKWIIQQIKITITTKVRRKEKDPTIDGKPTIIIPNANGPQIMLILINIKKDPNLNDVRNKNVKILQRSLIALIKIPHSNVVTGQKARIIIN